MLAFSVIMILVVLGAIRMFLFCKDEAADRLRDITQMNPMGVLVGCFIVFWVGYVIMLVDVGILGTKDNSDKQKRG